jgi:hypothetical protein
MEQNNGILQRARNLLHEAGRILDQIANQTAFLGSGNLLCEVSTGHRRDDDGRLLIEQLADGLDPEDEGNEPGQHQRIGGEEMIGYIQFGSEEAKQEDNGKGQECNERFHFCDFAVLEKKFRCVAYAFALISRLE